MCTVTVIPLGDAGFRLVTNRDERRDRPAAIPPRRVVVPDAGIAALWPVDPTGGGTWVGVSDLGVAASTLNFNLRPDTETPRPPKARSRGAIIPAILSAPTAADAIAAVQALRIDAMLPFRLIAVDAAESWIARWDGESLAIDRAESGPVCLVSSGLGDALVQPRLELFDQEVLHLGSTPARQDAYHAHRWPDRPEISVAMERAAARTVSRTIVEVVPARVTMRYIPIGGEPAELTLTRSIARSNASG